MENSIEEITFVENEIKNTRRLSEEIGCHAFFDEDLCKAIEHILSDYKRVLKGNEELKADNYELNNRITDLLENIPIQKIKDKIETLEKVKEKNIKRNFDTVYKDGYFTGGIDSLRELLREE